MLITSCSFKIWIIVTSIYVLGFAWRWSLSKVCIWYWGNNFYCHSHNSAQLSSSRSDKVHEGWRDDESVLIQNRSISVERNTSYCRRYKKVNSTVQWLCLYRQRESREAKHYIVYLLLRTTIDYQSSLLQPNSSSTVTSGKNSLEVYFN